MMTKAVNCSCGASLVDSEGAVPRRRKLVIHDGEIYIHCPACRGHTRIGRCEGSDGPPKPEIRKSLMNIVFVSKSQSKQRGE
jgi:hypothetical protein